MCSSLVCCPLCYQSSFPNIDTLRNSLIKAANGPVSCPVCHETFLGLDKLTIHLFSHTTLLVTSTPETIPSDTSPIVSGLPSEHLENNGTAHKEIDRSPTASQMKEDESASTSSSVVEDACVNQLKCDICELTFRSTELLHMHNKLIHRVSGDLIGTTLAELRYQCHLCAKVFKMKGSLRVHLKVVHLIGLQPKSDNLKLSLCQRITNKSALAIAKSTAITLRSDQVAVEAKHLNNNTINSNNNNICSSNNSGSPDSNMPTVRHSPRISGATSSIRAPEAPKVWECDICSKSFTTKYFLKKHKRLHTGEMPYTCNICGKTFTFQQSYHKHLLYHSDEKPHTCQTCGRSFKELSTLHNHERIHSGEKPFKCEICGKCFRQRVSYLVHKRIHTGAMPYKCTSCDKSFRYKVSQRTHKCTVQPPGTVVRQGGDLLEKLLHSTSIISSTADNEVLAELIVDHDLERNLVQAQNHDDDFLIRSIDEFVSETCSKMGFESVVDASSISTVNCKNTVKDASLVRTPSPSEKLENLCLYSPSNNSLVSPLDAIYEEALKAILNETV